MRFYFINNNNNGMFCCKLRNGTKNMFSTNWSKNKKQNYRIYPRMTATIEILVYIDKCDQKNGPEGARGLLVFPRNIFTKKLHSICQLKYIVF